MKFTLNDIAKSACARLNPHLFPGQHAKEKRKKVKRKPRTYTIGGRRVVKHFPKGSEEKNWIEIILIDWSQKKCLELYEEFFFVSDRGWRFDWCLPQLKVAIEYEGGIHNPNGDHRSVKGISRDISKYNRAGQEGWQVLRFTTLNYKTLIDELNKLR